MLRRLINTHESTICRLLEVIMIVEAFIFLIELSLWIGIFTRS